MGRPTKDQQIKKQQGRINAMSKRRYKIATSEGGVLLMHATSIGEIVFPLDNDAEVMYALNDQLDKVLDLKVGDTMYFQPIRDNKNTKGIITRIS